MLLILKQMKRHFLFFTIFFVASAILPLTLEAKSCKKACSKYKVCVVDYWKKQGKKPSQSQKNKLYPGCMKTCKKHKKKVLACYKKSKDSCESYWVCIRKHYKK